MTGNPEWWELAVAGLCSHGGHGWDGETCDDAPMARTCDDCGAAPGEECAWTCSSNWDRCGICQLPIPDGSRVEEYAGLMTHYGCVPR